MPNTAPLVAPVIALVIWSGLIWAWMYATRIPAILKMRMRLDPMMPRGEQMATLPPRVRWEYGFQPEAGSDEARLAQYLVPRDWLG